MILQTLKIKNTKSQHVRMIKEEISQRISAQQMSVTISKKKGYNPLYFHFSEFVNFLNFIINLSTPKYCLELSTID